MQIRNVAVGTCCFALAVYAASLSNADRQFLTMAAKADMSEAHEGQMAANQAKRGDVKDFAKVMVQDHTDNYERLTQLAAKTGATIPKGINAAKDRTMMQLVHLKGEHFDRQFAMDEITAHKQAIAMFKHEAATAKDPDVKAFAADTIPVLEKHLKLAEACAKAPAGHS